MSYATNYPTNHGATIRDFTAALLACVLAFAILAKDVSAQPVISKVNGNKHAGELIVPVNKSQVLRLDVPFANLLVGNPKIADVLALTNQSIYVLGKEIGTTSLIISDRNKQPIAVLDIVVSHDVAGLKARLFEVLPKEKIEVRNVNGSVILSGRVSSATRVSQAAAIAKQYAPDPAKVVNLLSVKGSQQVMLAVRFAEVKRSIAKELGLNTKLTGKKFSITTGDALASGAFSATAFLAGTLGPMGIAAANLSILFDALEEKGVVKTLAEPNLIALSGDTASFLAGGEFPVPVAQSTNDGGSTITIEFKEFGVSLSFTPTVLDDGLINIVVAPEVSTIDTTNSVTLSGFTIPGLTTRRAKTTVELRDGQSFAIAGLIQSDFQDTIRQIPGLGDVPILSALFRSTDFKRDETELVIIVTPHLVKPAEPGTLRTPVDNFALPSDSDMYLFGRPEPLVPVGRSAKAANSAAVEGAGGIKGRYGHIVK